MTLLGKLRKHKPKTPAEVISKLVVTLAVLDAGKEKEKERNEVIPKYLAELKLFLLGDHEHGATKQSALLVAHEACGTELLLLLVKHLGLLSFECRKSAATVFTTIVRIHDDDGKYPGVNYIMKRPSILELLSGGLAMDNQMLLSLFPRLEVSNFEIASDAFSSFKFFPTYMNLLQSSNYVVRRLSLKLLGEILLCHANVKVMVRYVSEPAYLMQMMMLLRDPSPNIQYEAFHVFKVQVCNPSKPEAIVAILENNQSKLLKFMENFQPEREYEPQFKEEKDAVIHEISELGKPAVAEVKPALAQPAQAEPVQAQPVLAQPAEVEPAQEQADQALLAQAEPAEEQAALAQPAQAEPVQAQPALAQPAQAEPAQEQADQSLVTEAEPTQEQPALAQPTEAEPAQEQANQALPNEAEPAQEQPALAQPTEAEPAQELSALAQPTEAEPAQEQSALAQPTEAEPAQEQANQAPPAQAPLTNGTTPEQQPLFATEGAAPPSFTTANSQCGTAPPAALQPASAEALPIGGLHI
eukprot:gene14070-20015_t